MPARTRRALACRGIAGVAGGCRCARSTRGSRRRARLSWSGAEVDRVVEPDRYEWRRVRSAVAADGCDPEELGLFERPPRVVPARGDGVGVAEPRVQLGLRGAHRDSLTGLGVNSFQCPSETI